jgi:glycosyltransferase involved in cell wall biosynthesis
MPSLSVVVPAHNEEANVAAALEDVFGVIETLEGEHEIILVNDGSTDRTGEIARTLAQRMPNLRLVEHLPSRHYGGALKAGFAAATKELIAFFPGDCQFVFCEVHRLLAKIDEADIVSGYRADRRDNWLRRLIAATWNLGVRSLFGYLCRDIDCGFKLFRREILAQVELDTDGAMVDLELLAGAKALGYRIAEVELTHRPRTAGKATGANLAVIALALRELLKFRLQLWRRMRRTARPQPTQEHR